jgi:ActR/RegA family two-component response regulator
MKNIRVPIRLLIFEDMDDQREFIVRLVEMSNPDIEIDAASSKEQAFSFLENKKLTPYHVVVTDMRQLGDPDGGRTIEKEAGMSIITKARDISQWTEIIVITAYGNLHNVYDSIERGASQYISKEMNNYENILVKTINNRGKIAYTCECYEDIMGKNADILKIIRILRKLIDDSDDPNRTAKDNTVMQKIKNKILKIMELATHNR